MNSAVCSFWSLFKPIDLAIPFNCVMAHKRVTIYSKEQDDPGATGLKKWNQTARESTSLLGSSRLGKSAWQARLGDP